MQQRSATDTVIIFRASREDRDAIEQVSDHLKLTRSEISRRAVRLGLEILDKSGVPGTTVQLKSKTREKRP